MRRIVFLTLLALAGCGPPDIDTRMQQKCAEIFRESPGARRIVIDRVTMESGRDRFVFEAFDGEARR